MFGIDCHFENVAYCQTNAYGSIRYINPLPKINHKIAPQDCRFSLNNNGLEVKQA